MLNKNIEILLKIFLPTFQTTSCYRRPLLGFSSHAAAGGMAAMGVSMGAALGTALVVWQEEERRCEAGGTR